MHQLYKLIITAQNRLDTQFSIQDIYFQSFDKAMNWVHLNTKQILTWTQSSYGNKCLEANHENWIFNIVDISESDVPAYDYSKPHPRM